MTVLILNNINIYSYIIMNYQVEKNLTIPKGSSLIFWVYKLHRNKKYWNDPLKFDPNRFLSGNIHSYSFLPFGIGARNCLGNSIFSQIIKIKFQKVTQQHVFTIVFTFLGQTFAMLEMKVVIATILRRFIIKIDRPIVIEDIAVKLNITLKPAKPIALQFERRN